MKSGLRPALERSDDRQIIGRGGMKRLPYILCAAVLASCATDQPPQNEKLTDYDTRALCRMVFEATDPTRREQIASLILKRGANAERCRSLVEADNAIMTGIAVGIAAGAVGAAAANNGYGGYAPSGYGVAWDQFRDGNGGLIWRCRDRATVGSPTITIARAKRWWTRLGRAGAPDLSAPAN